MDDKRQAPSGAVYRTENIRVLSVPDTFAGRLLSVYLNRQG